MSHVRSSKYGSGKSKLLRVGSFKPTTYNGAYQENTLLKQIANERRAKKAEARAARTLPKKRSEELYVTSEDDEKPDKKPDEPFSVTIYVGEHKQKFNVEIDTGSSELWILPAAKDKDNDKLRHQRFDRCSSKSCKNIVKDGSWEENFIDGGFASGKAVLDDVSVDGVRIEQQAIGLADHVDSDFLRGENDGILGLGWRNASAINPEALLPIHEAGERTFVENFGSGMFMTKLEIDNESGEVQDTFHILKDVDAQEKFPELKFTKVDNTEGLWKVKSEGIKVDGFSLPRPGNSAIIDTGSSYVHLDENLCLAIYANIEGARFDLTSHTWIFPITSATKLPKVEIAIGDDYFTLNKEDHIFEDSDTAGFVIGGIQPRGNLSYDILGDVFLRSIDAVFDVTREQFGAIPRAKIQKSNGFTNGHIEEE